jgi:predicted Zn-dependent peptidase
MVLVVCGDVDFDEVMKIADEHLPKDFIGDSAKKINENESEPRDVQKEYVSQRMQVSKPIFCIGIKDTDIPNEPIERAKKDAVMAILNETLFSAAGEFYNSMFEKNIISPGLMAGYTITDSYAHFTLEGEGDDPQKFLSEFQSYISRVMSEGLNKDDFERTKRVLFAEQVKGFDSTEGIGDAIFSCAADGIGVFDYFELLNRVTYEDASKEFLKLFSSPQTVLSVIDPIEK